MASIQQAVESPLVVADLLAKNQRLEAEVARLKAPFAEDFQILKNAENDSGVPRQTLMNWVRDHKVKHRYDEHDVLWICVIDARRQRFALAPAMGRNGR